MRTHRRAHTPSRTGLALAIAAATALLAGCVTPQPAMRLAQPTDVATAFVRDDTLERVAHPVPEAVVVGVEEMLSARNIVARPVPDDTYQPAFGGLRDTDRRRAHLAAQGGADGVLLLVETQAVFYSQLSGRYRWTVYVKLTLGAGDTVLVDEFDLGAVLSFAHENEEDALRAVSHEIARKAGRLVDDYFAQGAGASTPSAPAAPAGEPQSKADSVYFILVDRFANADADNDTVGAAQVDPADAAAWHGGDLRGVIEHLDYLERLGVSTLWLSPVFKTRYGDFMGHGAFHGYWVEDIGAIDPRFGSEADLLELTNDAHARGMRVVLDLVVNHVGYEAPLLREHPDWFHTRGTIESWDDPVQIVENDVHGLPDLAQENPEVYAYVRDASSGWLRRAGIDGFRLDAVKHVPLAFWGRFNAELTEQHGPIVLLGELFDGDPRVVERVQREGRFTHMFDFPVAYALRDVFCHDASPGQLAAVLSNDRLYGDSRSMVTFLDNHDMPRVRTECGGDAQRVYAALLAQLALRGVPALTYGTETGAQGGPEPFNRADMVFEDTSGASLLELSRELLALRAGHPSLARGKSRVVRLDDERLVLARWADGDLALLVVWGAGRTQDTSLHDRDIQAALPEFLRGLPLRTAAVSPHHTDANAGAEVALLLLEGEVPAEVRDALEGDTGPRQVIFTVDADGLAVDDTLLVVGSGPELGGWDVRQAPSAARTPDGGVVTLALPAHEVFAYKLVVRGAEGQVRWEEGANRQLFVAPGENALQVSLTLRSP